jgi:UDP-N-acetylmuramyl tripeptide synthase
LKQGRVRGLSFATAIFTNLTHDHLDYHGSFEDYGASKQILFASERLKKRGNQQRRPRSVAVCWTLCRAASMRSATVLRTPARGCARSIRCSAPTAWRRRS